MSASCSMIIDYESIVGWSYNAFLFYERSMCVMKGYMTLVEAGEKWEVSPRLLNTYCLKGRITGAERAGRIWMIPESAEKPIDLRVRSGSYKGWRKKYSKNKEN